MFTVGLIVNPFAGIGGSVALKGSDGKAIREEALRRGAEQLAPLKARTALEAIPQELRCHIKLLTASGEMGERSAREAGFEPEVIAEIPQPSEAKDTQWLVEQFQERTVDLILFAGGDGTARDVFAALTKDIPVLGIPAGCKIHSGVYAVTPKAAGVLIAQLAQGEILSLREASVMDIDEEAFREGRVRARNFGSMIVPDSLQYIQATKQGGKEVEELVLEDIAADVIESMESGVFYAIGSGTTCAAIMEQLGLENTLLGVDVVTDGTLVAKDVTAKDLLELVEQGHRLEVFITLIGGQGHIIGRGNQQISPKLIRAIGWDKVHVIATKTKLKSLEGRPLIVDSGDAELDESLNGTKKVITGYHDSVLYRVGLDY
jgi:predicted polyphosphate/ATP-dependent NAD kinase